MDPQQNGSEAIGALGIRGKKPPIHLLTPLLAVLHRGSSDGAGAGGFTTSVW